MAKRGTIYIQTESAQIMFEDAVTIASESNTFANEIANQTLEDGSNLADHIIVQQDELECQIFVSNAVPQKSQDIYAQLKNIRNKREICKVYTEHQIYDRMVIESVNAPHEAPMVNQITFTVKFKQVDWGFPTISNQPVSVQQVQNPSDGAIRVDDVGIWQKLAEICQQSKVEQTASSSKDVGQLSAETVSGPVEQFVEPITYVWNK